MLSNDNLPLVSVVVPVFNSMPYLEQCISSLRNQTLSNIEIIAINDGSSDASPSFLDEAAQKDRRITVIHKPNGGVSSARNKGIDIAKGDYIFFCDADDWMEPDGLASMYYEAINKKADIVSADYYRYSNGKDYLKRLFSDAFTTTERSVLDIIQVALLYTGESTLQSACFSRINSFGGAAWHHLIKRDLISENDLRFDTKLTMLEDGVFLLGVFEIANSYSYISKPTYHYRISADSAGHQFDATFNNRFIKALKELQKYKNVHNKSEIFQQGIYMRSVSWISNACQLYYCNSSNKSSFLSRYSSFRQFVKSSPYYEAIENVSLDLFGSESMCRRAFLLKKHLYLLFWLLEERKRRLNA